MIRFSHADHIRIYRVEEDSESTANQKLALPGYVIGEPNARCDTVVVRGNQRRQNTLITWKTEAADCSGEDRRLDTRNKGGRLSVWFKPLEWQLVTNAQIQRQLRGHAPIVLQPDEDRVLDATLAPPVLRLHGIGEAEYAVRNADAGVSRAEGQLPRIVLSGEVLQSKKGKPA